MAKLGKLDEGSLMLVINEFNRCKKGTDYKNYRITDYIDSGRFARVYAVEGFFGGMIGEKLGGKKSGKKLALRITDDDRSEQDVQKNLRELSAVKQLMSDGQKHIVEYLMNFTVETEFGLKYCSLMPFLSTLSKYRNTADDVELAVRCGCDLLPLLQTCMQRQIIHRDIKPQNIFFDRDFRNESGLILGDFGEARWDSEGTVSGIGTPATVSPEIACFDEDIKNEHSLCDMYSLGVVMYYYLNGRTYPFGNNEEAHRKRLSTKGTLPAPKYGSRRLKQLVLKATQYYPSKRFQSPLEMLKELEKCEEYDHFVLMTDSSLEETQTPEHFMVNQIARLQAENRAIREKAIQYRKQLEEIKKRDNQQHSESQQSFRQPEVIRVRRTDSRQQSGQIQQRRPLPRLIVHIGDKLKFGSYPQTSAGDAEQLVWRVLEVRDGKALIITDQLIDYKRFNDNLTEVTWENCTLRKWLNGDFMAKAFGSLRPERVVPVTNRNQSTQSHDYANDNPTRDQVFVLSADEAKRYFGSAENMIAYTTDYAHKQKFDYDDRSDDWWLRTSGVNNRNAVCVSHSGGVKKTGCDVNYYNVAVRPALWLKL